MTNRVDFEAEAGGAHARMGGTLAVAGARAVHVGILPPAVQVPWFTCCWMAKEPAAPASVGYDSIDASSTFEPHGWAGTALAALGGAGQQRNAAVNEQSTLYQFSQADTTLKQMRSPETLPWTASLNFVITLLQRRNALMPSR